MLCQQVMKHDVKCLKEQDTVQVAAKMMRDSEVGFLPVCGPGGKVVGTITDRDIVLRLAADGGVVGTSVDKLMTRDVVSCKANDDLRRAEQLMQDHRKSRIVCVDDQGRAVGVISLSDVAQYEDAAHFSNLIRTVTQRGARKA
jgi:CBS domain-containing protein